MKKKKWLSWVLLDSWLGFVVYGIVRRCGLKSKEGVELLTVTTLTSYIKKELETCALCN